jgi:hypothetical protein
MLRDGGESARHALFESHSHPSCDASWIRPPHPNAPATATLSQQQFLEALSLRMLLPPPYLRSPNRIGQRRVCICNAINRQESPVLRHKSHFYHCLSCSLMAKSTQDRHNTVQEVLRKSLLTLGGFVQVEDAQWLQRRVAGRGRDRARADLSVRIGDRAYAIDVKCMDSTCPMYQGRSLNSVLQLGEDQKHNSFISFLTRDVTLIAFVLDIDGCLGQEAINFVDQIHDIVRESHPLFRSYFRRNLSRALAVIRADTVNEFTCKVCGWRIHRDQDN